MTATVIDLTDSVHKTYDNQHNRYLVEFTFEAKCLGGQPKSPDVLQKWVRGKLEKEAKVAEKKDLPYPSPEQRDEILEAQTERMVGASPDELTDTKLLERWCGFFTDAGGWPWMGTYQLKAAIKEVALSIGITKARVGSKQSMQALFDVRACNEKGDPLYGPEGDMIYFERDGEIVTEPDGWLERTIHVQTPMGPRDSIVRNDYLQAATIRFVILTGAQLYNSRSRARLDDKLITEILAHAGPNGTGASRSQGFGKFTVTKLLKLTDVAPVRPK